jgi:hypothetical protein
MDGRPATVPTTKQRAARFVRAGSSNQIRIQRANTSSRQWQSCVRTKALHLPETKGHPTTKFPGLGTGVAVLRTYIVLQASCVPTCSVTNKQFSAQCTYNSKTMHVLDLRGLSRQARAHWQGTIACSASVALVTIANWMRHASRSVQPPYDLSRACYAIARVCQSAIAILIKSLRP